jgi:hypothetical protein
LPSIATEWGAGDRTVSGLIQNEEQKRLCNRHGIYIHTYIQTDRQTVGHINQ